MPDNYQTRIDQLANKVLDRIGDALDETAPPPAPQRARRLAVARRRVANMLRVSQLCANRACRRAGCCRGEPLECLHAALPLVPVDTLEGLLRRRRRRHTRL